MQGLLKARNGDARAVRTSAPDTHTKLPYAAMPLVPLPTCRVGRTGRAGDKEGVAYTLLLGKKDAHFAGLLVNSLSLGGQEIPNELHSLAMNVSIARTIALCIGACMRD